MEQRTFQLERADYRLAPPKIVRTWFGIGAGSFVLGLAISVWAATQPRGVFIVVGDVLIGFGCWSLVVTCWIVWSSASGTLLREHHCTILPKPFAPDHLLATIQALGVKVLPDGSPLSARLQAP